jgi:hypothetical protein
MTEAEFERRITSSSSPGETQTASTLNADANDVITSGEGESTARTASSPTRSRTPRAKLPKPRRVQRMFAIEEDIDKKLWLYAIHTGKDRSEVVNDLLKPVVASMVLYDSRDRRAGRSTEILPERSADGDGEFTS